jgi:hypothetical protein
VTEFLAFATTALTFALVCVTIWYAWQTQQMVREMASARAATVRPALRLDYGVLPEGLAFLVLENVGVGPAVQVSVGLEVKGFTTSHEPDSLKVPLLRSGENIVLHYPAWGDRDLMSLDNLASVPATIRMSGDCLDLDGARHSVSDELSFAAPQDRIPRLDIVDAQARQTQILDAVRRELAESNRLQRNGGEG